MNHYEVNFIIDPVLSGDEIKSTASTYESLLKDQGCSIVHVQAMGLKQLAYPINKKSSGIYYCVEFTAATGAVISKTELSLRRDERIMRFLTVKLDKYGVKYNEDRRSGKITAYRKKEAKKKTYDTGAPVVKDELVAKVPEVVTPVIVAPEVIVPVVVAPEVIIPEVVAPAIVTPEVIIPAVVASAIVASEVIIPDEEAPEIIASDVIIPDEAAPIIVNEEE